MLIIATEPDTPHQHNDSHWIVASSFHAQCPYLEALFQLIHSLPTPAKASKHSAGQLLCLGVPQNCPKRRLHLHRAYISQAQPAKATKPYSGSSFALGPYTCALGITCTCSVLS